MEKIGESVKIKKIAITGSLSAGKSTVAELLKPLGAYVLKADDIVHSLLSQDVIIIQKIKEVFGNDVISETKVDRKLLADQVFANSEKLKSLEAILHPIVVETVRNTYALMKDSADYKAFVVEFPLLFEIGFDDWFDQIIYVTAENGIRLKRFIEKGFSEEQFKLRQNRLIPDLEKISRAHTIIENNGSLKNLNNQLTNLL